MRYRPKKALSQNFLIDDTVIENLIVHADICAEEEVIEIGPGHGAITKKLLKAGANVTAIELDSHLAAKLIHPQLTVIEGDALKIDYTKLPTNKVIGNLPFQIATPLITRLIHLPFTSISVIVQKEVGERLTAQNSTKAYSALTIATQNRCTARYLFTIAPSAFHPKPKIDSAAIQLLPHSPLYDLDMDFVFSAFRQRRKMLKSSLKKQFPNIAAVMQTLNLDLNARPENLSLEEFHLLYKKLFA